MKKTIATILIVGLAFVGTGCSKSKDEVVKLNNEISNLNEKIQQLESEIEGLNNKEEEQQVTTEESAVNDSDVVCEYSSYIPDSESMDEVFESIAKEIRAEGKNPISFKKENADRIIILRTSGEITNVCLLDLDSEKLSNCGFDVIKYAKEYVNEGEGELIGEVTPKDVLIIATHETEGMPTDAITWVDAAGKVGAYEVVYQGKQ